MTVKGQGNEFFPAMWDLIYEKEEKGDPTWQLFPVLYLDSYDLLTAWDKRKST